MTEDEMVGCHHQLSGHEFEKALGDGKGQGILTCCSPWGHRESDTTEQLNTTTLCCKISVYTKHHNNTRRQELYYPQVMEEKESLSNLSVSKSSNNDWGSKREE